MAEEAIVALEAVYASDPWGSGHPGDDLWDVLNPDINNEVEVDIQADRTDPPEIKPACWMIALQNLNSGSVAKKIVGSRGTAQDAARLSSYMGQLILNGGELGTAMVMAWLAGDSQVIWTMNASEAPQSGQPDGIFTLRLNPGEADFSLNSLGPSAPIDLSLIIGHELGHAVVGLTSIGTPSLVILPGPTGDPFDYGLEAANTAFVENVLRNSYNNSPFTVLPNETMRSTYGNYNVYSTLYENGPAMQTYAQAMSNKVMDFIANTKTSHDCW